jgi:hypothetical protein
MRIHLSQACPATLRGADWIVAVDRNRPEYYEQLYVARCVAVGRMPGTGPYLNKDVEVEIDSTDDSQLRQIRERVRAAGLLPDDEVPE